MFGPDALFADLFGTPEMFEIFSDQRMLQAWLDAEVALACSEAALGLIPEEAAETIRSRADASQFDLKTLREGIETTDQLAKVREAGCHQGQGFLWSPAIPLHDAEHHLLDVRRGIARQQLRR